MQIYISFFLEDRILSSDMIEVYDFVLFAPLKPSSQAFVCGRFLIEELKFMISCSSTAAFVVSYQLRLDFAGSSQFDAGKHDRGG